MGCCPSAPKNAMNLDDLLEDEDAAGAKISKKEKRKQDKKRLNNAPDSASFSEEPMEPEERDMKLRTKQKRTLRGKRGVVSGVDLEEVNEFPSNEPSSPQLDDDSGTGSSSSSTAFHAVPSHWNTDHHCRKRQSSARAPRGHDWLLFGRFTRRRPTNT